MTHRIWHKWLKGLFRSIWLRIFLTVAVIIVLMINVKIRQTVEELRGFTPLWLVIPFTMIFIIRIFQNVINYHVLIRAIGGKIGLKATSRAVVQSWILAYVGIGRIGEVSVIHLLKNRGLPYSLGASVYMADKLLTLFILWIISIPAIILVMPNNIRPWIFFLIICGLSMMAIMVLAKKFGRLLMLLIKRLLGLNMDKLTESLKCLMHSKQALLLNSFNTLLRIGLYGVTSFILLKGLGHNVPIIYLISINIINQLLCMLPISISNLGIQEAWYVLALRAMGVSAETAIAFSLIGRILVAVLISLIVVIDTFCLWIGKYYRTARNNRS